jgi:hypothetical protein
MEELLDKRTAPPPMHPRLIATRPTPPLKAVSAWILQVAGHAFAHPINCLAREVVAPTLPSQTPKVVVVAEEPM